MSSIYRHGIVALIEDTKPLTKVKGRSVAILLNTYPSITCHTIITDDTNTKDQKASNG
jgi:hypothetical protein